MAARGRVCLDTNILVYAVDRDSGDMQHGCAGFGSDSVPSRRVPVSSEARSQARIADMRGSNHSFARREYARCGRMAELL